ncbi:Crinkler (CRN) [Phytophthora megakarya]|uniref:Crinkler (CRN) n=1 Tax=Phytophthora megakarya TaxID=4795 RepID=A0A225UP69_9STRA|nr:Crinkler (CRN) [Phytophthora megakarya]
MGVVIDGTRETPVEFSSEMMRRLCFEALPVRETERVANTDDPFELFAASLGLKRVYASIRGIFKANSVSTKNVFAEARDPYDKLTRRLNIIVSNGGMYGYEFKANLLKENDIKAAVRQADDYRELLKIDRMFLVTRYEIKCTKWNSILPSSSCHLSGYLRRVHSQFQTE